MKNECMVRAWEEAFWFAILRIRRLHPLSASRGIAFKCAELIGYDRCLMKVDSRQPGGKGNV